MDIVEEIRMAKSAHLQWRAYAQGLVAGVPIDEAKLPIKHTECKFGRWYHGPGQKLSHLPSFLGINVPHEMLHNVYQQLHDQLLEDDTDISGLAELFSDKQRKRKQQHEKIEALLNKLIAVSQTLLEAITILEKDIQDLPDEFNLD